MNKEKRRQLLQTFKEQFKVYPESKIILDETAITEEQRELLDKIISELIKSFNLSSKKAKKRSRKGIDKCIKAYNEKIDSRKKVLKDSSLRIKYNIPKHELKEQLESLQLLLNYWKHRRATDTKYWIIESDLFIYFRWMDINQIDDYIQRILIKNLMELCNYHGADKYPVDRLLKLKKEIFSYMEKDAELEKALIFSIEKTLKKDGVSDKKIKELIQEAQTRRN